MGKRWMFLAGAAVGLLSVLLTKLGNPPNMGVCVACFLRDVAGGLGLHRAQVVQYLRPEVAGFVLGSFLLARSRGELRAAGGSSPLIRFVMGAFVMVGAMVFLGCPLRMVLRLSAGDLNALVGLFGFVAGIYWGLFFLKRGFYLGRSQSLPQANGYVMPLMAAALLALLLAHPSFVFFSEKGPGSMRAPVLASLLVGLAVGALAQRSRLCMAGGIRDVLLMGDFHLLSAFGGIFLSALVFNLAVGNFKLGFVGQPIAHSDHLWNFLGMSLVGLGSVLLGGCPLRQLIMAGYGDADAAVTVLGMLFGAAFAHNFGLASSPQGATLAGKVAVVVGLVFSSALAAYGAGVFESAFSPAAREGEA